MTTEQTPRQILNIGQFDNVGPLKVIQMKPCDHKLTGLHDLWQWDVDT